MVQWLRLHASIVGGMGLIPGQGTKIHLLHDMAKKTTTYVWMLSSQKGGWTAFMTNCFLAQTHPFTLHFLALRLPAPSLILLRGSTRKTKGWKEKVHVSSCFACCSRQHYSSSSSSPWWQQLTPVFSTFSVSFLSLKHRNQLSPHQRTGFWLYRSIPSTF